MKITATIELTPEEVVNFVKTLVGVVAQKESTSAPTVRKVIKAPADVQKPKANDPPKVVKKGKTKTPIKKSLVKKDRVVRKVAPRRTARRWTQEEVDWLKAQPGAKTGANQALISAFKKRFGYERSMKSLSMKRQEIHGLRDKFKKRK